MSGDDPRRGASKDDRCQRGRNPVVREDGSIEIPLTRGQVALVDAEGYLMVRDQQWRAVWHPRTRSFRAVSGTRPAVLLHRAVTRAAHGVMIDHINHDTLDNRLVNLRTAMPGENQYNQRPQIGKSSRYKGVTWYARTRRWRVQIRIARKYRFLGYYASEEEAAKVYDAAARALHGEFAFTNEMAGLLPAQSP